MIFPLSDVILDLPPLFCLLFFFRDLKLLPIHSELAQRKMVIYVLCAWSFNAGGRENNSAFYESGTLPNVTSFSNKIIDVCYISCKKRGGGYMWTVPPSGFFELNGTIGECSDLCSSFLIDRDTAETLFRCRYRVRLDRETDSNTWPQENGNRCEARCLLVSRRENMFSHYGDRTFPTGGQKNCPSEPPKWYSNFEFD